ncbi:ankyrin repeat-containing domain protein [Favolaschia claudopus]|uniref:Ankyrin repeat-containing domain protein n=1 Tax=Favolaschia claudopus TaxID=2862362 RepID=A0AAW0AIB9_9AGAR
MPVGFADLPAELILLLSTCLPMPSLHALVLTCRRHHDILQPELEARITPEIASNALRRAVTESKPHLVAKFLSPPHSVKSSTNTWYFSQTPLHLAALSENLEIARMLLEAGANPNVQWGQHDELPLEIAFGKRNVELMTLLLDHGAKIWRMIHTACAIGHIAMMQLLLDRGEDIEGRDWHRTPLASAVAARKLDAVKYLLDRGADATTTMQLFTLSRYPQPHRANLLYSAMGLRHPSGTGPIQAVMKRQQKNPHGRWEGLPMDSETKELMAVLLAHGASKDGAMETVSENLSALAKEAGHTEEEFLNVVTAMIREAEAVSPFWNTLLQHIYLCVSRAHEPRWEGKRR